MQNREPNTELLNERQTSSLDRFMKVFPYTRVMRYEKQLVYSLRNRSYLAQMHREAKALIAAAGLNLTTDSHETVFGATLVVSASNIVNTENQSQYD